MRRFEPDAAREIGLDLELFDDFGGPVQIPEDRVRRLLTATDVARYCGVATDEVLNWIDSGRLVASYVPHGRYRITSGDFVAFLRRFDVAI